MTRGAGKRTMQNDAAVAFGRFLRQWRLAVPLNQTDLGKAWGKSQSTISEYEQGAQEVERQDLERLAIIVKKPFNDVLETWIQCHRNATVQTKSGSESYFYLPSGRKAYIETPDGQPMPLTPDDLARLDLELSLLEQRKQRG